MGIFTLKLIPQGTRKTLILQESCIIHGTYSPLLKASLELLADGCCQPFTLDNQYLQTGGKKESQFCDTQNFKNSVELRFKIWTVDCAASYRDFW
jgi:hypothetical protein